MSEDFLHFIWKQQAYTNDCVTTTGKAFEILNPGEHNQDAGPDFFNARIKMDGTIWAGNVEIHIKSSDWDNHKHQNDSAYNNVILHVVAEYDKRIFTKDGREPETWVLKFPEEYSQAWIELLQSLRWIPCEHLIHTVREIDILLWMQRLAIERLESKANAIKSEMIQDNIDFDTVFFRTLTRYFGFNTNQIPFEMLAKSMKWQQIAKHRNHITQIEAFLFGQAGFLAGELKDDEYFTKLKQEYKLLKTKFSLHPVDVSLWKFSRMRPGNFPSIRISQLAMLLHKNERIFSHILDAENLINLMNVLKTESSDYWLNHYRFGESSEEKPKRIGKSSLEILLINAVIPILFLYGDIKNQQEYKDKALGFLEEINAENNSIIRKWSELGINAENAMESQALIHLKKHYCNPKKCLTCRIGQSIIFRKA
jgi:hypothetical protein